MNLNLDEIQMLLAAANAASAAQQQQAQAALLAAAQQQQQQQQTPSSSSRGRATPSSGSRDSSKNRSTPTTIQNGGTFTRNHAQAPRVFAHWKWQLYKKVDKQVSEKAINLRA